MLPILTTQCVDFKTSLKLVARPISRQLGRRLRESRDPGARLVSGKGQGIWPFGPETFGYGNISYFPLLVLKGIYHYWKYGYGSKIQPPGIGPQSLVHVSIYQGNPFWGHPIFDNHSHLGCREENRNPEV